MILIKQRDLIQALRVRILEGSTNYVSGTYDSVDPTRFEKASARFELEYGLTRSPIVDRNEQPILDSAGIPILNDIPDPEVVTVEYHDCTWGVDLKFKTSMGESSAYFDFRSYHDQGGEWCNCTDSELFSKVFLEVLSAPLVKRLAV